MTSLPLPLASLEPGEPNRYTGVVRVGRVAGSHDSTIRLYQVLFAAGARTVWHLHSGEQVLLALQGSFIVQIAGESPQLVLEDTAVRVPPGSRHWHGALPTAAACHLAVNIATTTRWFDPVSESEYHDAVENASRASMP